MTPYSFFFSLLTLLDVLCIITVIFVERKNPASTIAWVFVIAFVPFAGFAAYLMFGSGFHLNKKKRYAFKLISDSLYKQVLSRHIQNADTLEQSESLSHARLIRYLQADGGQYYTRNNAARIFTHGSEMFAHMREDILRAQKHIHLLYYIIRNDTLGRELVALLTQKARGGVEVRLIYDSLGSLLSGERMFRKLRAAGGRVEAFSPLLFTLSSHLRLNFRNHRKITVIDGQVGYVGGMNIGEEYLGRHKKLHPWRDTHLRLVGPCVGFLQERFLMDWLSVNDVEPRAEELRRFFSAPLDEEGNLGVQIVSSGPDTATSPIKNGLLEMLYTARKNVFIQTPYFTPDDSFIEALRIAVGGGVDVRLMIPVLHDHLVVGLATQSYAWQLLEAGVRVYAYQGFLHAKTMVFDGEAAAIGSANIGTRSFALNFESNAFLYGRAFAAEYERIFLQDQENCLRLTPEWFLGRGMLSRGAYGMCRLLAPLI